MSKVCAPVICCCALHFVDNVQSLHNAHFSFKKTAVNPTQISSENDTGSSMEEIEEDQSEPGGQKKNKTARRSKKSRKRKEEEEELLLDDEEGDKSIEEEDDNAAKPRKAADLKREEERIEVKSRGRNSVLGECREEKAPFVTVREAKVVTLANKVSTACII